MGFLPFGGLLCLSFLGVAFGLFAFWGLALLVLFGGCFWAFCFLWACFACPFWGLLLGFLLFGGLLCLSFLGVAFGLFAFLGACFACPFGALGAFCVEVFGTLLGLEGDTASCNLLCVSGFSIIVLPFVFFTYLYHRNMYFLLIAKVANFWEFAICLCLFCADYLILYVFWRACCCGRGGTRFGVQNHGSVLS
ncbi:MAG: hypothetical protein PHR45_05575 [Muribaculaceae bacterium]|nr:hypothetical protein [Muribaculaceae bacterium]